MAPLPTIADVVRLDLVWNTVNGVKPVNVLNVQTTSDDAQDIAGAVFDAMESSGPIFSPLQSDYHLQALGVTFLDGHTARIEVPYTDVNIHGGYAGQTSPATAAVLSIRTGTRGSRGRGRVYIGPCAEAAIDSGLLLNDAYEDLRDSWPAFDAALLTSTPVIKLGVASYIHADWHQALSTAPSQIVGTQRRRQDQLR